jgi:hypothetical protein
MQQNATKKFSLHIICTKNIVIGPLFKRVINKGGKRDWNSLEVKNIAETKIEIA